MVDNAMDKEWFAVFSETLEREQNRISSHTLEYAKAVRSGELSQAENVLGFELPAELKSLLMEFNGIHEYVIKDGGERIQIGSIIWDLAKIVEWHKSWTVPNGLSLFCFGNSALGNCFGYLLENGKPKENEIWQSDHETEPPDEYTIRRASSLREFIATSLAESLWF
jgi:hypothetical protein